MRKPSTTKTARERGLDSFAPAVYLEFIRNNMLLFRRDILGEFIQIEAHLEYEEIRKKVDQIINKKSAPIPKDARPCNVVVTEIMLFFLLKHPLTERVELVSSSHDAIYIRIDR